MNKGRNFRFNIDWLSGEEYKDWLLPEELDNTKARCKICKKTFSLSNIGETAVKSHAEGRNMLVLSKYPKEQFVSDFFKKKEISTEKCSSEKSGATSNGLAFSRKTEQESSQLTKLAFRKEQHKPEILWALKSVMSHFSYSSACDIVDVFKAMFPDSNILKE